MRLGTLTLLAAVLACLSMPLPGRAAPEAPGTVLQSWDFEQDTDAWISFNAGAIIGLTSVQADVYQGTSSLELQYTYQNAPPPAPPPAGGAAAPPIDGSLFHQLPQGAAGMTAVSLALKTSYSVNIMVGLMKANGGVYLAPIFSPAGEWRSHLLPLTAFTPLADHPDPDGRLDLGTINAIGFFDASGFLGTQLGKLPVAGFTPGPRRLWLDDVRLLAAPAPPATAASVEPVADGSFRFLVLGGEDWQIAREEAAGARPAAYRLSYALPAGTALVAFKPLPAGLLADAKGLHLSIRTDRKLAFVVGVEEQGKARYMHQVTLEPGAVATELALPWSEFQLDPATPDADGQLDPGQLTIFSLADLSALASADSLKTTLWLGPVTILK
ncbi:MAG TPA: hypothetical protein VGM19_04375 [Armatimonadota bacterium]|jgi:hypothetical protein